MTTLLFGSERDANDTAQMPIHAPASRIAAGENQVAVARTESMPEVQAPARAPARFETSLPSIPPVSVSKPRSFAALPAMMTGLLSTAALWLGLALFLIAVAYPLSDFTRAALTIIGSSLVAIPVALAIGVRPEYA